MSFGNYPVVIFVDRPLNIYDCHRIYWKRRQNKPNKRQGVDVVVEEVVIREEEEDVGVVEVQEEAGEVEVEVGEEEEAAVDGEENRRVEGDSSS